MTAMSNIIFSIKFACIIASHKYSICDVTKDFCTINDHHLILRKVHESMATSIRLQRPDFRRRSDDNVWRRQIWIPSHRAFQSSLKDSLVRAATPQNTYRRITGSRVQYFETVLKVKNKRAPFTYSYLVPGLYTLAEHGDVHVSRFFRISIHTLYDIQHTYAHVGEYECPTSPPLCGNKDLIQVDWILVTPD